MTNICQYMSNVDDLAWKLSRCKWRCRVYWIGCINFVKQIEKDVSSDLFVISSWKHDTYVIWRRRFLFLDDRCLRLSYERTPVILSALLDIDLIEKRVRIFRVGVYRKVSIFLRNRTLEETEWLSVLQSLSCNVRDNWFNLSVWICLENRREWWSSIMNERDVFFFRIRHVSAYVGNTIN